MLVGITGAPGSGKSTLTDAIVREFRRRRPDRRVGVVAVDPSSPFTGGAVLGDRVRMMRHATDPMVFVRSLASRGHLGGLALGVKGIVHVMGLLGCERVIIETVGVGQSEVEVAGVADLVMIVLAPGLGDSVQLLKAGLMEIGDLFVVNKADRPGAERLHGDLLAMLHATQEDPTGHHGYVPDEEVGEDLAPWLSRRPGSLLEPETFLVSAERGQGSRNWRSGFSRWATRTAMCGSSTASRRSKTRSARRSSKKPRGVCATRSANSAPPKEARRGVLVAPSRSNRRRAGCSKRQPGDASRAAGSAS